MFIGGTVAFFLDNTIPGLYFSTYSYNQRAGSPTPILMLWRYYNLAIYLSERKSWTRIKFFHLMSYTLLRGKQCPKPTVSYYRNNKVLYKKLIIFSVIQVQRRSEAYWLGQIKLDLEIARRNAGRNLNVMTCPLEMIISIRMFYNSTTQLRPLIPIIASFRVPNTGRIMTRNNNLGIT